MNELPITKQTRSVYVVEYNGRRRTYLTKKGATNWLARHIFRATFDRWCIASERVLDEIARIMTEHGVEMAERWIRWAIDSHEWGGECQWDDDGEFTFDPDEYRDNPLAVAEGDFSYEYN